jgi:RNA polymerase sigma factor (sigma-70 family)
VLNSTELFELLVREHSRMLAAYLRAAGCDGALVDDVWQETMIVAWRKLDQFDRSKPFGPWLRGIAARTMLSAQRKHARLSLIGDEHLLEDLSQRFERVHQLNGDTLDEKLGVLRDCLSRLSDSDRQCLELRFKEGLMPAAISTRLDLALEAVKKRLLRAKHRVQICFESKLPQGASDARV